MSSANNNSLVISEVGCCNLRYFDPDRQIVRRATAILRFQLGQLRQKSAPHPKSADPMWPTSHVFTELNSKYKSGVLRVEVWDYASDEPLDSKPLGFMELSLANLHDGVPYPFSGRVFHTEGCFPPPDRLPPMELAMVVLWNSGHCPPQATNLTETSKANYVELRNLFPKIKKQILVNCLVRNNYDIEMATDELLATLQDKVVATPQGREMSSQSMFAMQSVEKTGSRSFTALRKQMINPTVHHGQLRSINPGLVPAVGTVDSPGDDGTGMIDGSSHGGRRKALLIGINYYGTKKELNGCHDDVERMRQLITKIYGFASHPNLMTVLSDESEDSRLWPTRSNILLACQVPIGTYETHAVMVHSNKFGDHSCYSITLRIYTVLRLTASMKVLCPWITS
eukprot:GHVH01003570.1.p1 GENE.GHVH01003570.1~~GHVH01003570.1.p1  ORF type:complete len:397 (+),score=37.37 GHVH01003570.1:243-1433(+)